MLRALEVGGLRLTEEQLLLSDLSDSDRETAD